MRKWMDKGAATAEGGTPAPRGVILPMTPNSQSKNQTRVVRIKLHHTNYWHIATHDEHDTDTFTVPIHVSEPH